MVKSTSSIIGSYNEKRINFFLIKNLFLNVPILHFFISKKLIINYKCIVISGQWPKLSNVSITSKNQQHKI